MKSTKDVLIVACSVGVAAITACVTAVNTEGKLDTKLFAGVVSGVVAGFGTYAGAIVFPILPNNKWIEGLSAFADGYLAGMRTDRISVTAQTVSKPAGEYIDSVLPTPEQPASPVYSSGVGGGGRNTYYCLM